MTGVYEVYVKTHFSAAHALNGYDGDCSRMHGHNWMVEVYVQCKKLNEIGIGVDFRDIKATVKAVLSDLDHFNLNDLPAFTNLNPTSENIARFLYAEIGKKLNSQDARVAKVKVCETPGAGAVYWEE
jgi:6-pyruvoyltetrahydropterin/6-carboxytetrahydropterin synthase